MQPQNAGLKENGVFAPLAGDITLRCDEINQKNKEIHGFFGDALGRNGAKKIKAYPVKLKS